MKAFLVLGAALVLFNAPRTQAATLVDRIEASVNSSLILLSDIRTFKQTLRLRSQIDPLFPNTPLSKKGVDATNEEIRDFLIDERLITSQFPVSDTDAESEINQIQSNNKMSRETLKSLLAQQGFAFDEYFELIRASASKRNLIDRDIRTKVTVSDDDVKNYFFNHYARSSSIPVSYRIQVITISTKNYKSTAAAQDTAKHALQEIRAGESFEEVAKRLSDDASASSGGDLGQLSEDQMSPVIRTQAKKLQIGQISEVFAASNGFYILKLVDVKTGDSDRYEQMKEQIRGQLAASEYQHQISLWLDRQRQSAFVHKAGESSTVGLPKIQNKQ